MYYFIAFMYNKAHIKRLNTVPFQGSMSKQKTGSKQMFHESNSSNAEMGYCRGNI